MARKIPRYEREAAAREAAAKSEKPQGRLAADIAQQVPHNSYGGAPLFYEDQEFTCKDCGKVDVWTREQQKWWYETAKGPIYSMAVRCLACRNALADSHDGTPRRSHRERRDQSNTEEAG